MSEAPPSRPTPRKFESLGSRSGTILGRYELVRRIGTGGMAEVYEAVHRGLKKTVAVKVLLPETAENAELRARFLREGEAASRIQHPHVVDVTDVAEEGGVPYLVMEFLEGQTLSHLINDSPQHRLSLSRTLDILLPVAAALDEAHRQGVVHRDLKPENVFIARASNGRAIPKILDFGVSKLTGSGIPSTTAVSAVLGTPHYMSPEQARGEAHIDGRADQYSFALMLYECITGTLPFHSDNVVALIHEVAKGVGTAPSAFLPVLPPELDIILLKALGADPDRRYATVGVLADKLLPFATPRAQEAYLALRDKEPHSSPNSLPPPAEITGTFMPARGERRPTPTVAQRPSGKATPVAIEPPTTVPQSESADTSRRPLLAIAALVVLLGLGIGGYLLFGRAAGASAGSSPETPPAAVATPVAVVPAPPETPPEPETPPPPVEARVHVAIVASPSSAEILLDDQVVGTGELDRWVPIDGEGHRLVVRAPGFVERTFDFTDEAPPLRVELVASAPEHTRRPGGGGGHASEGTEAPPPPDGDDDIRSAR